MDDITGFELSEKMLKHAQSYGLEWLQREAVAVEPGDRIHSVRLSDGRVLRAHAVILAMGGKSRKLNVPGEEEYTGRGVSYCATCDGFFFRNRPVVVVGGGDSAVEEALYLARLVKKVTMVHRRDQFRAGKVLQSRLFADPKVEVLRKTVVTEIKGSGGAVAAVSLLDTETGVRSELATEGIFIYVGFDPNKELVPPGVIISPNGYVVTDEKCETNLPGIFVAGDLRRKYANQIVIAAADGCTAALAAARYVELIRS
jgi:thioredoxin reductase (NADPH)